MDNAEIITAVIMKKSIKTTYAPPSVDVVSCDFAHSVLTGSVEVPNALIEDAEEEEWIVS